MEDLIVRFKILFDALLAIEDGPDVESILFKSLRILVRKLGCTAGAVFLPGTSSSAARFELAVSVPWRIEGDEIMRRATELIHQMSPTELLQQRDPSPIRQCVGERGFLYLIPLPEVGLLVLEKVGVELSNEMLLSLRPVSNRLAGACLAQRTKETLQESNQRFRALVDNADDSIVVFDENGTIVDANARAQRWFALSLEQLRTKSCAELGISSPTACSWSELFADSSSRGTSMTWEQDLADGSGQTIATELRLGVYSFQARRRGLVWIKDISDRRQLERERIQGALERERAKRLESLGLMTSGIAHDFNNMLLAIQGHVELALLDTAPDGSVAESLRLIDATARNLAALTKQLLAFSGAGRFQLHPLDLRQLAYRVADMLRVSLPGNVKVALDAHADPLFIVGDPAQMEQIVVNLLTNAAEAYGELEGIVDVRLRRTVVDGDAVAARALPLKPGNYVTVSVEDKACGMTAEQQSKIFDPFFTTKPSGRGLGLAAAQGIARGHGGTIVVESTPGVGTLFQVLVPAYDGPLRRPDAAEQAATPAYAATVLVVDDEPVVLRIATRMLQRIGCQVLAASGGREALSILQQHADAVHLALVDLSMPDMDGIAVHDALRTLRPDLPIVISSGHSSAEVACRLRDRSSTRFIQKPYSLDQLREVLAATLGQQA